MSRERVDYDVIIIGSGFGGSVPALRLTDKGYRVAVLEQGRRVTPDDMRAADERLRELGRAARTPEDVARIAELDIIIVDIEIDPTRRLPL